MTDISREELWGRLKQGVLDPVYVLFGPETYLRDRAAAEIAGHAFSDTDLRDFNESEFSLLVKENLAPAIAAARQFPMMSTRRVIRITDVRIGATSMKDTLREEYEELLAGYLSDPADSSIVVFIADELNGNRRLTRLLRKHSVAVEFKRVSGAELSRWVKRTAADAGAEIDDNAVRRLLDLVGTDLRRLTNEVKKLATASIPANVIDAGLIDALVVNTNEPENFALASAVVSGRGELALSILKRVLDGGGEPLALVGMLSYTFRRSLIVKAMMMRGDERRSVSGALNIRGRNEESFLAAARRVDMSCLMSAFERLRRADVEMKTSVGGGGSRGSRLQVEMLVCELCMLLDGATTRAQARARG